MKPPGYSLIIALLLTCKAQESQVCLPSVDAGPPSVVNPSLLTLTFDDEFEVYDISSTNVSDGLYINEKWFTNMGFCCLLPNSPYSGIVYPTPNQMGEVVNPFSITPSGLDISLSLLGTQWNSGLLHSVNGQAQGFSQTYGYFEISAQLPPGSGGWPAFWMLSLPLKPTADGEIDIFENYGSGYPIEEPETSFVFSIHDWRVDSTHSTSFIAKDLPNLTTDYHRYGVWWSDQTIALYFDGCQLFTTETPSIMVGVPYYMLTDLGVSGNTLTTQNPSILKIRYIRAYQFQ